MWKPLLLVSGLTLLGAGGIIYTKAFDPFLSGSAQLAAAGPNTPAAFPESDPDNLVRTKKQVPLEGTADELVKQGDVFDLQFKPTEALRFYLPAEVKDPKNAAILLRIARQFRHQMADAPAANEKTRLAGMALDYAQRAVALAPGDSEAHLSIAICHAKSIEILTNKEKMDALRQVKASADKAIALDPSNHLAWYILGRWHQQVAAMGGVKRKVAEMAYGELPDASDEDAAKCFLKANSLDPKRSVYLVDLGITYAAMGEEGKARTCIEKGLALPSTGKDDPKTYQRGKETLKTLE